MDTDLALILGIALGGLSIPSILSAVSETQPPRVPSLFLLAGAGLIAYAMLSHPGGYRLEQIPDVFFSVLGRLF
ncbi:hypothetical protein [Pseudophaeobacter sp.]|jgi:hypothetical protein|uniref:Uncharacterized protein n=1 Tax=Pseudophaeobacter arcticus TaxID=385492 RepID=A0ABQ0AIH9_9RHOB|nr:hypothetical protein [Pseudophaeobacter sp.]UWS80097.1 hypothetical protein N1037_03460 [Phaeobacter sp. G2]